MVWEITIEDLLKKYTSGKRNFAGAVVIKENECGRNYIDLEGAVLRDINLRGADLSFADLKGADLSGADLFGASFIEARLDNAIVRDANLECVNLFRCYLIGADLVGSHLYQANAIGTIFRKARFLYGGENNVFIRADFRGASIPHDAICRAMNKLLRT